MSSDNLTAILYGIEDIRLEQRPIPNIKDDQVLLRMDSIGICGSDVHYLVHGRIGEFILQKPMVMGHESSGVVHKVGKSVTHLKVGDRVAIEPGVPCRYCENCKQGKYNLCPGMIFCATPPVDGNLTRYYAHAADFCFKLPDHVTMEEGSLLEPLSVGIHACRRANIGLGTKVLILGAGPIGLSVLISALSMGAGGIIITDILDERLKLAKELGATHTLIVSRDLKEEDLVKKVHDILGTAPDVSIDCSGLEATNRLALLATKSAGCVVIVGCGPPDVKIPLISALTREIDIRGVFRYCNDYPAALALVSSGKINVKKMMTHHFDMEETKKAFDTARYNRDGAIKVIIHCTPRDENNPKPF
ncbi:sorbitol dehydrogenase-like isoform X5 [Sitodiplosis mosellana]|uniref:sorbitol dehydrogenase-like isoform X5 n=1 Tax=Sitodiplosis mosellana TaxID=263140 RepID=UPI002443BADD|nr:sorbitol dehydrogenase-like isoform X5 [Sitodiplosis mosellana]